MPTNIDAAVIRLRELEQKATPGILEYDRPCVFNANNEIVARCPTMTKDSEALMMFFVEARNLLPALLKAYEAQEREIERLKEAVIDAEVKGYTTREDEDREEMERLRGLVRELINCYAPAKLVDVHEIDERRELLTRPDVKALGEE